MDFNKKLIKSDREIGYTLKKTSCDLKIEKSILRARSIDRIFSIYTSRKNHLKTYHKILIINLTAKLFHYDYLDILYKNNIHNLTKERELIPLHIGDILLEINHSKLDYYSAVRLLVSLGKLNIKNHILIEKAVNEINSNFKNIQRFPRDISFIVNALANYNIQSDWLKNLFIELKPIIIEKLDIFTHEDLIQIFWAYTVALKYNNIHFLKTLFNKINELDNYKNAYLFKLYLIITYNNLKIGAQKFTCNKKLWNNIIYNLKETDFTITNFHKEVVHELINMGYQPNVEKEVCNFYVDIYLRVHSKEYVIECDGDKFHYYNDSSIHAMFALKDKIFKLLKLNIVRIKHSDWKNTKNKKYFLEQLIFHRQFRALSANQMDKLQELKVSLSK